MPDRESKMGVIGSIIFFGIPGGLMVIGVRIFVPATLRAGWPLVISYPLFVWLPVILLLAFVLIRFFRDPDRETFSERFRLKKPSPKIWLWIVGGFILVQALELAAVPTRAILARVSIFAPAPSTPQLFDPSFSIEGGLTRFFGVPVEGNWWLIGFWLLWLLINIGGEELLWRGYALPLQEKVFGRHAWIVNGLLWNFFVHAFMPWGYITLLPISLILPYLVQRHRNTWIGIVIHGVGNLLVLAVLIPGIIG
jgi:membrane protease YdiL (CAAX protease family)